jgi:hypothetical protein
VAEDDGAEAIRVELLRLKADDEERLRSIRRKARRGVYGEHTGDVRRLIEERDAFYRAWQAVASVANERGTESDALRTQLEAASIAADEEARRVGEQAGEIETLRRDLGRMTVARDVIADLCIGRNRLERPVAGDRAGGAGTRWRFTVKRWHFTEGARRWVHVQADGGPPFLRGTQIAFQLPEDDPRLLDWEYDLLELAKAKNDPGADRG